MVKMFTVSVDKPVAILPGQPLQVRQIKSFNGLIKI
jgi:hypothetical protein